MEQEFEAIDCLVGINNAIKTVNRKISAILTIYMDPFNISKSMITFKGRNKVICSMDEFHRRIIHWFYRNYDAPNLKDWLKCLSIFNLKEVPIHVLQLYNSDLTPSYKFIIIHSVEDGYVTYTLEDRDENSSVTVRIPLGIAALVPERFLFNMKIYSKRPNN